MRPDIDACRDPDILAAEVRRLRAVIAASQPTLTAGEREAIEQAAIRVEALCQLGSQRRAATLRSLLERLK